MTVTIHCLPTLFKSAVDEIFSGYGLVTEHEPVIVVCASIEKYEDLQEQLDEAGLEYVSSISETLLIDSKNDSPSLRLLLHYIFAQYVFLDNELKVHVPPEHREVACLFLIHYVIYEQHDNATLIVQTDPRIETQLIEVVKPLDYVYDFPLQLLILTVPKERKERCETMIRKLLEPSRWPGEKPRTPIEKSECIIEIEDEHSLVIHFTEFQLLRNHFAFTRIEILPDDRIELFFENFSDKQEVLKYLEERRSERENALSVNQGGNVVCFIISDARRDLSRIERLNPLKFQLISDMAKCLFRSQAERDTAVRLWLECGGEIYDIEGK